MPRQEKTAPGNSPSTSLPTQGVPDEIAGNFLSESLDRLDAVENAMLACESKPERQSESINRALREFHTIKGNAGVVLCLLEQQDHWEGQVLQRIQLLAHVVESFLQVFRDGGELLATADVSLVLMAKDRLRRLFHAFSAGIDDSTAIDDLLVLCEQKCANAPEQHATHEKSAPQEEQDKTPAESPCVRALRETVAMLQKGLRHMNNPSVRPQILKKMLLSLKSFNNALEANGRIELSAVAQKAMTAVRTLGQAWDEDKAPDLVQEIQMACTVFETWIIRLAEEPSAAVTAQQALSTDQDAAFSPEFDHSIQQSMVRVPQQRLDKLMNLISELLVGKNALGHVAHGLSAYALPPEILAKVKETVGTVGRLSDELQTTIMAVRMTPVRQVFSRFPRLLRDLSAKLGKEVRLEMEGKETELDKKILETISDPLVHLVRNAIDHGLEQPDIREKNGKDRQGLIRLQAANMGQNVVITIIDDGQGVNTQKVREKALAQGILDAEKAGAMTDEEINNLIFRPGFSTAKEITEVSGRGVGLDVVRRGVEASRGSVHLASTPGQGTAITMQLPLSLALSRGLRVSLAGQQFYLPLAHVVETAKVKGEAFHRHRDQIMVVLRDLVLPVRDLSPLLRSSWLAPNAIPEPRSGFAQADADRQRSLVVLHSEDHGQIALEVDQILREEEYVIKPLTGHLNRIPGVLGAVITSEGRVNLVIDPFTF